MDYTSVSVAAKRFREKMDNDEKMLEMIQKIAGKMKGN